MVDGMVGELWSIPLKSKRIQEGRSHCLLNGTTTKTLLTCVPVTSGCASSQESIRHLAKQQDYYMFQLVHYVHTGLNGKRNGPRRTFNLRCFLLMVIGGVRGNRLRKKKKRRRKHYDLPAGRENQPEDMILCTKLNILHLVIKLLGDSGESPKVSPHHRVYSSHQCGTSNDNRRC